MLKTKDLTDQYRDKYRRSPLIVQAPGRINIIGEHTDYNDGFVLPAAIDRSAVFAIQLNQTKICNVTALDLNNSSSFSLLEPLKRADSGWLNIVLGVVHGFLKRGVDIEGFDLMFTSNIPVGAGMSSSAAIECGLGTALNELFTAGLRREEIALIGQQAEHEFVGVKCGIMDQFASTFGKADQVIKIDCRSMEREYFSAQFGDHQVVLIDSKVKHELVESEYNIRIKQCEEGVLSLKRKRPEIIALRDATLSDLESIKTDIEPLVYDRCRYVIEENVRVVEACEALENKRIERVGELMYMTHDGLSNLYEVSCSELDLLVNLTLEEPAIIGSRMMGGGFGGCTINLIEKAKVNEVTSKILLAYKSAAGIDADVYNLNISDGASIVSKPSHTRI